MIIDNTIDMVAKGVIVALVFLALADRGLSLSCRRCYEYFPTEDGQTVQVSICGPTPTCSHGLVKGVCGCCDVCAKGPGESCGGFWNFGGRCSAGYWCAVPTILRYEEYLGIDEGICVTHEVDIFYQVPIGSDFEVRLYFSVNSEPTSLDWYYGPNFQDMPNIIQTPSDKGKFSTSWIDLQDNNYQAILKITGITQDDIETKFKLHITNDSGETDYRVMLSVIPTTPENETTTSVPTTTDFEITTIVSTTKEIVTTFPWTCGQYNWQNC